MLHNLDYEAAFGGDYLGLFVVGIRNTLLLFVVCWGVALALASILTVVRTIPNRIIQSLIAAYVEYHRNVPVLVQILVWYFAIPQLLPEVVNNYLNRHDSEAVYSAIALSLFSAAYMSEDLRSGLRSIPVGQYEAARSVGMSHIKAVRWIILPQVMRISVVPLVNQTLVLFKATSLASALGVTELTFQTMQIESQTFRIFETLSAATLVYMLVAFALMFAGKTLSQRVKLARK